MPRCGSHHLVVLIGMLYGLPAREMESNLVIPLLACLRVSDVAVLFKRASMESSGRSASAFCVPKCRALEHKMFEVMTPNP